MIRITFPDQSIKEYEDGISPREIAKSISNRLGKEALGALVDGKPWDLTRPLIGDCALQILTWNDPQGREVYRHSSTHLMAQAVKALYPDAKLTVGPPLEDRYYYDIDMPALSESDFEKIEAKMAEFAKANLTIEREEISREEAKVLFAEDQYKLEILNDIPDGEMVTIYRQGDWFDLCRGPHLPSTRYIKAFKMLSVAGAYWRGDANNAQLQRLYGTSFPSKSELEQFLELLEEAKKRDHRKLGRELGLFILSPDVGVGLPIWLPKGAILRKTLEDFIRDELLKRGYQPVYTPHIARTELFKISGHMTAYADSMFPVMKSENDEFVLKPVNCPFHIQVYKSEQRSYRDLPLRYAEFGTVYRWEQSGEVGGLTRVRGSTQDDAHLFLRSDQLGEEFKANVDLVLLVLKRLGLKYTARVGLRGFENKEKYVGSEEAWNESQSALLETVKDLDLDYTIAEGEAAIYGPKLDFMVHDAIGREWQLGTVQVDYVLPERFDLEYIGADGKAHRPVMIHRAPFGSLERFCGVLIEHFAGAFPFWLAPVQIQLLPISDRHQDYAKALQQELQCAGYRVEGNYESETIGAKIAKAETQKYPFMIVLGDKEVEENSISLRAHGRKNIGAMTREDLFSTLKTAQES
ncbi:MAG: threonine--tRNA ligase [Abditibacteriaceae bacterium]